jgi:hypothetical protein
MTVTTENPTNVFPEELDNEFADAVEEIELEGLSNEEQKTLIEAGESVLSDYTGFQMTVSCGPKSRQWPEALKKVALAAAGGGDTGSTNMSDKLFSKDIDAVAELNAAVSAAGALKNDRYYTLPHPRSGLRRVRLGRVEELKEKIEAARRRLHAAGVKMNEERETIKDVMREKLKARFDEKIYDVDFTEWMQITTTFPAIDPPEALKQFQSIYEGEVRRVQAEAQQTIAILNRQLAEEFYDAIDHLVERLEQRKALDKKHTVKHIEPGDNDTYVVTYLEKGKEKEIELDAAAFKRRVTDDKRKKTFTDATATKIFDTIEEFERVMKGTGFALGEVQECLTRLKGIVRAESRKTLPNTLRQSEGSRDAMRQQLASVGDQLLQLAVVKGRRQILRKRSKSATFNPERV